MGSCLNRDLWDLWDLWDCGHCLNARRIWSSTPQIADCRGLHGCRGFGERAMNRTTTNRRATPLIPLIRGNKKGRFSRLKWNSR